ncbi:MAG: HEPN domain-containing protein [Lentisphaerota bacterium]
MTIENEWLKAAQLDLENIAYICEIDRLTPVIAFHSQQAVEKSLKALLEYQKVSIPKVHKLQTLLSLINRVLNLDEKMVQTLDELYIDSRYPGDLGLLPNGKPTLDDAKELYDFAKAVYLKVSEIVHI